MYAYLILGYLVFVNIERCKIVEKNAGCVRVFAFVFVVQYGLFLLLVWFHRDIFSQKYLNLLSNANFWNVKMLECWNVWRACPVVPFLLSSRSLSVYLTCFRYFRIDIFWVVFVLHILTNKCKICFWHTVWLRLYCVIICCWILRQ